MFIFIFRGPCLVYCVTALADSERCVAMYSLQFCSVQKRHVSLNFKKKTGRKLCNRCLYTSTKDRQKEKVKQKRSRTFGMHYFADMIWGYFRYDQIPSSFAHVGILGIVDDFLKCFCSNRLNSVNFATNAVDLLVSKPVRRSVHLTFSSPSAVQSST